MSNEVLQVTGVRQRCAPVNARRGAQVGKDGRILSADGLKVGGSVFLDSDADRGAFTAAGAVRLAVTAGGEADFEPVRVAFAG